jgi:hypothetical protein
MALFAAGCGHPGLAMVAAAALLSSVGLGVGVVGAIVHYDHRHAGAPRTCSNGAIITHPNAVGGEAQPNRAGAVVGNAF